MQRPVGSERAGAGRNGTAARFFALRLVNPLTATAFAAIVLGLPSGSGTVTAVAAFAAGLFAASFAWQSAIATAGAIVGSRLPPGARTATTLVGAAIVALLALRLAAG